MHQIMGAAQPLAEAGQRVEALILRTTLSRDAVELLGERTILLAGLAHRVIEGRLGAARIVLAAPGLERLEVEQCQLACSPLHADLAQLGLQGCMSVRCLRLLLERAQLAPQLTQHGAQLLDVPVDRLELLHGTLAATSMLEDACGLLDVAASLLRTGVEDVVELALTDDRVQLAAEPGVAEQLLHVERADLLTVDLVGAEPVLLDGACDAHLTEGAGGCGGTDPDVLEATVGVVDDDLDARPATTRPPGRAGEDDVGHGRTADLLHRVRAEDPRERVDDVGLARAVRTDDDGDAGLDLQRRRISERLEAAHRE